MARKLILTHPDNVRYIRDKFAPAYPVPPYTVMGLEIISDPNIPRTAPIGEPVFEEWPFTDWEKSDSSWAIFFGFAKRSEEPVFHLIDTSFMNPLPFQHERPYR